MKRIITTLFLALSLPAAALANSHAPKPSQLVQQVQHGISQYGVHEDISGLPPIAIAQLKGIIDRKGTYSNKRNAIRTVLRNNGFNL